MTMQATHMSESPGAASRARYKLLGSMLMTYGYTVAGIAVIQPFFSTGQLQFDLIRWFAFLFALALQVIAIYLAPRGEKP
jgi:hypothetical protein